MSFLLHPRLDADTVVLGELPLCRVLLSLDGRYPWVVLVPRREGIREIHELSTEDRAVLVEECAAISQAMQTTLSADKMNVAALGNMVPQLHVHVVARYEGDDAWPGAIWGAHPPLSYLGEQRAARVAQLRAAFGDIVAFEPGAERPE